MSPDPDAAREHFRKKNRALTDKQMTVKDAVSKFIPDGTYIAIGGFGGVRVPVAIMHEILREGKKNLGLSGHTATHDFQILAAGECFDLNKYVGSAGDVLYGQIIRPSQSR